VASIKPSLTALLIGHSFTVVYIPLAICLFYFSTARSRKTPIFLANAFNIIFAITVGIVDDYRAVCVYPSSSARINAPPIGVLGAFQSIIVDTILLLRLVAVYPRRSVGLRAFVLLVTLPVLLKVARVINISLF
ncbi:hypothetical protein FISHEDRAFT_26213, partial [Fistulina hepatica ATCC 64428]